VLWCPFGLRPSPTRTSGLRGALAERQDAKVKAKVRARIVEKAKMILLDLMLPNGKPLRECTGADCAKLGPAMGAWLSRIAGEVKPRQKVGDILSEESVRELFVNA
jgi:hypothetical protein